MQAQWLANWSVEVRNSPRLRKRAQMTQRRTRHRTREAKSALVVGDTYHSPQDQLNDATPDVTRCAWPQCRAPMTAVSIDHEPIRFGVLCQTHAVDVMFAVVQSQKTNNFIKYVFEKQTTEQAVRAAKWRSEDERHEAAKAALRRDRDGFVYYLRVGERVKIGYSVDVKRRMRSYPPGSELLAVEPGDRDLETQRHRQFTGSLLDGREWFRPTPDIDELVAEIVGTYGDPKRFSHHYRSKREPMRVRAS